MSTDNSSDWAGASIVLVALVVLLVFVISIPCSIANEEQTKQEAIKAGLVQNDKGHWVRPKLKEKK